MNTTLRDAPRKPLFARGPGLALNFFLLALLSVVCMVIDGTSGTTARLRAWGAWALQPLQWAAQLPQGLGQLGEDFDSRETLLAENRQFKLHQTELEGRLLKLESLQAENERIRALLSSSASLPDRVLISEVLATSQDPYRHQIVLNRGARDGVYKGQALVDANGIMGQVIQVNPTTCVALLITDPDHGIPVEINRTGLQTIALGRGDGQGLSLPYLPGNADVKVGDLLVSSGLGGRFPAGYPVGAIFELRHPAGENFMEALAYPSAKLNQGRQALLVWSEHNAQPPDVSVPIERPVLQAKHKASPPAPALPAAAGAPPPAATPAATPPAAAAPATTPAAEAPATASAKPAPPHNLIGKRRVPSRHPAKPAAESPSDADGAGEPAAAPAAVPELSPDAAPAPQ